MVIECRNPVVAVDWLGQMAFAEDLHRLRETADERDPIRRVDP
jgi:hypothetical protein